MVKYNEKKLYKRLACLLCAVLFVFSLVAFPISFYNAFAEEITTNSQYISRPYTIFYIGSKQTGEYIPFDDSAHVFEGATHLDIQFKFSDTSNGVAFSTILGGIAVMPNVSDPANFRYDVLNYRVSETDPISSTGIYRQYVGNNIGSDAFIGLGNVTDFSYYDAIGRYVNFSFTSYIVNRVIFNSAFTSVSQLDHFSINYIPSGDVLTYVDGVPLVGSLTNFAVFNLTYYDINNTQLFNYQLITGLPYTNNYTFNGSLVSSTSSLDYNYDNAYNQGYRTAQQELTTFYESRLTSEYNKGFNAGKEQSTNFGQYFLAVAEVPFNVIRNMLNFEILGVNISGLVFAILTGALCITVIRWFI